MMPFRLFLFLFTSALLLFGHSSHAETKDRFSVQLMGSKDIGAYDGCRFALWQHNRSPSKDKYAYALFMPYNDGEALPIWIKINGQIKEMTPHARGGWRDGYVSKYMLFREQSGGYFAILNILGKKEAGQDLLITDARLRIVHSGKKTFTIRAKGHIACPKASVAKAPKAAPLKLAKDYDVISLKKIKFFKNLNAIPLVLRQHIRKNLPDCDLDSVPPLGSAYAVSPTRTLWEIPCFSGAYQGSYVYADMLKADKTYFTFLEFPGLRGKAPQKELLGPSLNPKKGIFISTAMDRGLGDCGTRTVYQLVPDIGEELVFILLEQRRKSKCDGRDIPPNEWPITYRRK